MGNHNVVTENIVAQVHPKEPPRTLALDRDLQTEYVDLVQSLKLVKYRTFKGRGWLIPLVTVSAIVFIICIVYNKLRQLLLQLLYVQVFLLAERNEA